MGRIVPDKASRRHKLITALGITALMLLMLMGIAGAAPYAYITNSGGGTVSVIDTATNNITATVNVGSAGLYGVAVNPTGTRVYVTNKNDNTVSVIDTAINNVTATVPVGEMPSGIAVTPDGTRVYVANEDSNNISVINATDNTVTDTVQVGLLPYGVAVTPDGKKAYVANHASMNVSVINTTDNTVTATVNVGDGPSGVAVDPTGTRVYVTNQLSDNISVINTTDDTVTSVTVSAPMGVAITPDGTKIYVARYATGSNSISVINTTDNNVTSVTVGRLPYGVAVTPDGTKVYVANLYDNTVSIINTTSNTVIATVPVGSSPFAFGQFIVPHLSSESVLPVANFTSNVTSGVAPLTVQFTDLSENATGWYWDFGDGNNSTEQNPVHTYFAAGNYTVNLTASNDNGTSLTNSTSTITVLEPVLPVANFSSNVTDGYAPLSVQFNDSSLNATTWNWDFGDGANSTQQNPTHVYSVKGNYTVNLTVSNLNGTNSKTAEITPYTRPYAYIPNQVSNNVSVIDTSNNRVVASVNVGNQPYGVAVNQNGKKVYVTNQGSNTVSVIDTTTNTVSATVTGFYYPQGVAVRPDGKKVYVANYFGKNVSVIDTATNTITATVKVGDFPNGIAVNSEGTKVYVTNQGNNNISVIDTSNNTVVASVNVEGSPYGVAVNPDGTKVYAALYANGKVSVIDTSNNTVVASVNVGSTLYNLAVNPEGTKVYVACWVTNKVSVIDTSNNTVVALVNEVNSPYGIAVNPKGTKVYVANYNSNIVTVIDTATNTVTTTVPVGNSPSAFGQFMTIGVEPVFPVANFSSNVTSGYVPLSVQFTDLSESATSLNWNFGDGNNSTQQNPIHTFSAAGNYTVNLTASNANGTDSYLTTINVSAQPVLPVANFSANITNGYAPLSVQFNDSSVNAANLSWNFGDGTNSTLQNPMHTFAEAGNYTVNLTASNANGTNSKTAVITVSAQPVIPVANFSSNVTSGYVPLSVQFTDLSESATSWNWNFGDGTNSTLHNPMCTYSAAGNYTVNLTASNLNGTNSRAAIINVSAQPVLPIANFSTNITSGYAPLSVQFNDNSTNTTSRNWNFGDGTNSTLQNPMHTFSAAGNYTVNLTASNLNGTNSTFANITVLEQTGLAGANLYLSENALESKHPGSSMNYTLYYQNFGDKIAQNVVLEDVLSSNVEFGSASDGGIYNNSTRKVTWDIGSVAPAEYGYRTITIEIPLNVSNGTVIYNNASINTSDPETGYEDNEISIHTLVASPNLPQNVSVEPTIGDAGIPSVYWGEPITFSYHSCDSATGVNISIHIDDGQPDIAGNMTGGPSDWNYTTIFYPRTGKATVNYTVYGCDQSTESFSIYVDPAGYIYDMDTENRIAGASVWLQRPDGMGGWVNVPTGQNPAISQPDTNPLITDDNGMYQWDVLNGSYRVHVEATGYEPKNSYAVMVPPAVTDLHVGLVRMPEANYSIFKSVINPDPTGDCIVNSPGDQIPYRIVVKNEGEVNLTNVTVSDPMLSLPEPTGDDTDPGVLNTGETWIYDVIYTLTPEDAENGSINNNATVVCSELPEKTSSVNTPVDQNADLSIYKSVTGIDEAGDHMINSPGDVINYRVAVKNNGDVDLTGVLVSDPMVNLTKTNGDSIDPEALNPGETWVYAGDYTVTQEDIDTNGNGMGLVTNTATVSCNELPTESSTLELQIIRIINTGTDSENNNTPAKVYPVADFSISVTSGYAPLTVQFTDRSTGSPTSWSWDFNNDGIVDSSKMSPVYTYNTPGTYTAKLMVGNANGTGSQLATITVLQKSSSNDGGSSSGGDSSSDSSHSSGSGTSGSAEPANNVEAKEISQAFIASGQSVKFDFPKNATSIVYVSFDSKKTFGKTTATVEMLKGKSTFVSALPSDEVYKHVNIWVGNSGVVTNNIENAVVCFKVEKSWIQDKKIDQSSITLNRYSDNKWEKLQTSQSGEDSNDLYFTAKTPGFTTFAITGKTTAHGTEIQPGIGTQDSEQNKGNIAANTEQTPGQKNNTSAPAKESKKTPGFEIICGITALLAVFLYRRN